MFGESLNNPLKLHRVESFQLANNSNTARFHSIGISHLSFHFNIDLLLSSNEIVFIER